MKKCNGVQFMLILVLLIGSFWNAWGQDTRAAQAYVKEVDVNGASIKSIGYAEVDPNSTVTVRINVENNATISSFSGYADCVLWFVDKDLSFINSIWSEFETCVPYDVGDEKWNINYQEPRPISEVSIEATSTYLLPNADRDLEVTFTAPSSGSVYFLVRATFSNEDWSLQSEDPSSYTGYYDDQGYKVYRYRIDVVQPPPDIKVLSIWTEPSPPVAGVSCELYVEVENIGDGTATSVDFTYYIDNSEVQTDYDSSISPDEIHEEHDPYTFSSSGSYTYKVVVDQCDGEIVTSNNSKTMTVNVVDPPDLQVDNVSLLNHSCFAGDDITVYFYAWNKGGSTSPPSQAGIYFGYEPYARDSEKLYTVNIDALQDNDAESYSATFTIPESIDLNYSWVSVFIDDDNVVYESNDNNNIGTVEFELSGKRPPVVSSFTPATPLNVLTNETVNFTVNVTDEDGDLFYIYWYLDFMPMTQFDTPISGSSGSSSFEEQGFVTGDHTIRAMIQDKYGNQIDQIWNVTASPPPPDLYVSSIYVDPYYAYAGNELKVYFTIINSGDGSSPTTQAGVYFGYEKYARDSQPLATVDITPLSWGNDSEDYLATFTIPEGIDPNYDWVNVYVDFDNTIPESNDNNNIDGEEFDLKLVNDPIINSFSPSTPLEILESEAVTFEIDIYDSDGDLTNLRWWQDGWPMTLSDKELSGTNGSGIHEVDWFPAGNHDVRAVVYDGFGNTVEQNWAITSYPAGDLEVTVLNPSGVLCTDGTEVYLKKDGEAISPPIETIEGKVKYTGIPATTYDMIRVLKPNSNSDYAEYWGDKGPITVPGNETFKRYMPYITGVLVTDLNNEQQEVPFIEGEDIKVRVEVTNDDVISHLVKVKNIIDRNKDLTYDFNETSTEISIGAKSSKFIDFIFSNATIGEYYVRPINTFSDSPYPTDFTLTDTYAWLDTPSFSVVDAPPALTLAPIGNQTGTPGDPLYFTIRATGGTENFTYSTSELPGTSYFNPVSQLFNWTNPIAGVYDNVSFYVNDGVNTVSESITITITEEGNLSIVQGNVTDVDTSQPVDDCSVIITGEEYSSSVLTDVNGFYLFENVPNDFYKVNTKKSGYEIGNETLNITTTDTYDVNFSIKYAGVNSLDFSNNNELTIYATDITEIGTTNVFNLSGNVNINNILYFEGDVTVDKSANFDLNELSAACPIYVQTDTGNKYIFDNSVSKKFYIDGNNLISFSSLFILDYEYKVSGFNMKMPALSIDPGGNSVTINLIPSLPAPFNKIVEWESLLPIDDNPYVLIKEGLEMYDMKKIFNKDGLDDYEFNLNLSQNFKAFDIKDFSLSYNTSTELFAGSFDLKIPGSLTGSKDESNSFNDLPVEIHDADNNLIGTTSFENFVSAYEKSGKLFLGIKFEIEFINGKIDRLKVRLYDVKIPIANTGLNITAIEGEVAGLTDNMKIGAHVDIETGLEIIGHPVVGLTDFGVEIQPMNYLKGEGDFEIFEYPAASGKLQFDGDKKSLEAEGVLNLFDILVGKLSTSLKWMDFQGKGNMTLKTPSDYPWYLGWLIWSFGGPDTILGQVDTRIHNFEMSSMVTLWDWLSVAQKVEFAPLDGFPYFHYHLGTNYEDLYQIFKGTRGGKQIINFQVPENSSQLFAVVTNETNLFDIQLTSPSGKIYNNTYDQYLQVSDANQTVVFISNPESGSWEFSTDQTGDIQFKSMLQNQRPVTLINNPLTKGTRSNLINIDFTDYSDTLSVDVYYDTDNKHFDGSFIKHFDLINNASLQFDWANSDINNGEYYIYTVISDSHNSPVCQYAPGSIIVNNWYADPPQNLIVQQESDSVKVVWDENFDTNIFATKVFIRNISDGFIDEICVTDLNMAYIKDLEYGREYEIWAKHMNIDMLMTEKSNVSNLIFQSFGKGNNIPYFTMDTDSVFEFVEGQYREYSFLANDADGQGLIFDIVDRPTGMIFNGDKFNWTPQEDQKGAYNLLVTVTDGIDTDSLYQEFSVYSDEQAQVVLNFASKNLYESDNMFIKIKNLLNTNTTETVTLKNKRTNEQTVVDLRKVDKYDYIGQFDLSYQAKSELSVTDGDTILASYIYDSQTYETYSIYDSKVQPTDVTAPSMINDLSVKKLSDNKVLLKWTATGDDGNTGEALYYDIRYSYTALANEDDYLVSIPIEHSRYPSLAGTTDSLIVDLYDIDNSVTNDQIYFSIKSEDEMQNRSELSNTASVNYLINALEVSAELNDIHNVDLSWIGPSKDSKDSTDFRYYKIFRKDSIGTFKFLTDTVTVPSYSESLKNYPDNEYQYLIQGVYETGNTDSLYSNTISLDRYENVTILCTLNDTIDYSGINMTITGSQPSDYYQSFNKTTNALGLIVLSDVYKTDYFVEISKDGYFTIIDTIKVNDSSNKFNWKVVSTALAAPSPGFPENNSYITDVAPEFDWNDIAYAKEYNLLVDNDSTFNSPEIYDSVAVSNYNCVANLADGTHFWKVKAKNNPYESVYSTVSKFTIGKAPIPPKLSIPVNSSAMADLTPEFDWTDISTATSYQIIVDDNSDFSSPEIDTTSTVSNFTPVTELGYEKYYWKTLAVNEFGESPYTATWEFELGKAPAVTKLYSPASSEYIDTQRPEFDWSDVANAAGYRILVDNDSTFSSPEVDENTTESILTPINDLAFGQYFWKALASNRYGESEFTEPWAFTIEEPLDAPVNVVTSISGSTLTLDWDAVNNATYYLVYASDDPYGEFTLTSMVTTNSYNVDVSVAKLFYYIVASNNQLAKEHGQQNTIKFENNGTEGK
ncbi:MAG: carboxypeptidase regulatory-like domain-containing protein [Candidatus Delongbacteria bacterium]|nr:carboxypeptidase regulatory-like domain-containing protein [Candidatus Delongbacteria bacterium]